MATGRDNEILQRVRELREEIIQYVPGKAVAHSDDIDFPKSLHIGLFGSVGCGKTSFLNSIMYAINGQWKRSRWLQAAEQDTMEGETMLRNAIKVTQSIYVVDNRGIGNPRTEAFCKEMENQIDGKRNYTKIVDWEHVRTPNKSEKGDCINVVVFVYNAGQTKGTDLMAFTELGRKLNRQRGNYPVAVITHVDKTKSNKIEHLKEYLNSCGIADVFSVANINAEKEDLELKYQKIVLDFLDRCLTDGDRSMILRHQKSVEAKARQKEEAEAERARQQEEARQKEEERKKEEARQKARQQEQEANKSWCQIM